MAGHGRCVARSCRRPRFADWINSVQKYVVSDTLSEADLTWEPTTIIRGSDVLNEVSALRDKPGGYLSVAGSASLVRTLFAADLVDELVLMIEPIALGGGKTIYPEDGEARTFELKSVKTAKTGVLVCQYEPAKAGSSYGRVRVTYHPTTRRHL